MSKYAKSFTSKIVRYLNFAVFFGLLLIPLSYSKQWDSGSKVVGGQPGDTCAGNHFFTVLDGSIACPKGWPPGVIQSGAGHSGDYCLDGKTMITNQGPWSCPRGWPAGMIPAGQGHTGDYCLSGAPMYTSGNWFCPR